MNNLTLLILKKIVDLHYVYKQYDSPDVYQVVN